LGQAPVPDQQRCNSIECSRIALLTAIAPPALAGATRTTSPIRCWRATIAEPCGHQGRTKAIGVGVPVPHVAHILLPVRHGSCANGSFSGRIPAQNRATWPVPWRPVPVPVPSSPVQLPEIGSRWTLRAGPPAGVALGRPADWDIWLRWAAAPADEMAESGCEFPAFSRFSASRGLWPIAGWMCRLGTGRLPYLVPPRCCLRRAWRIAGCLGAVDSAKPTPQQGLRVAPRAEAHGICQFIAVAKAILIRSVFDGFCCCVACRNSEWLKPSTPFDRPDLWASTTCRADWGRNLRRHLSAGRPC